TPTLLWSPVVGATAYDIWLSDVYTGISQVVRVPSSATSWTVTAPLSQGHAYAWWVRGLAVGANGPWSAGAAFTLPTLAKPVVVGPSTPIPSVLPTFTWQSVAGADFYDVWVDDTTTGQSQVLRNTHVTGLSWAAPAALTAGHTYTWWVRAQTND